MYVARNCHSYQLTVLSALCILLLPTCVLGLGNKALGSDAAEWNYIAIPSTGESGGWVLAPGSDIVKIVTAIDGTMYAAVNGLTHNLFISNDGGLRWYQTGNIQEEIVDIALCPGDSEIVIFATANRIYQSIDGGITFSVLPAGPVSAGSANRTITSIDVFMDNGIIIAVGVKDNDAGEFGGVYIFDERNLIPVWEDTEAGSHDVLAVAFSPQYCTDRHLIAVVTDETDSYIFFRQENRSWNTFVPSAKLNQDNTYPETPVAAKGAGIAFQNGFLTAPQPQNAILFTAISTGTGNGDVYMVSIGSPGELPIVRDLNIGQVYNKNNLDINCLAIEPTGQARIMAGSAEGTDIYTSDDGGSTWLKSTKSPAGSSVASLHMPEHFADNDCYAATSGNGSGLSLLHSKGIWDQISLIDTSLDTLLDFAPSPVYDIDSTLFFLSYGGSHSLWRSRDAGINWERVLWEGISEITAFNRIGLPPEYGISCNTVFCTGESNGIPGIIQSVNNGDTYRFRFTRDPLTGSPFTIDTWAVAGPETVIVTGFDGSQALVYRSDNSGFFFSPGINAGNQPLSNLALSPTFSQDGCMLASNGISIVYLYDTTGHFRPLPPDSDLSPFSGTVALAFDPRYAENHIVYAGGDSIDDGLYRIHTDADMTWEQIDITLPNKSRIQSIVTADDGAFYALNMATDGGMERSLLPTSRIPEFDTLTRGLADNAELFGAWISGNHIWSTDGGTRLVRFDDILTVPVTLLLPENGNGGTGSISDHAVHDVMLDWEPLPGATGYEWQCDDDSGFGNLTSELTGTTEASSIRLSSLEPGGTYYWRIRASGPVSSPWSEVRHFTTCLDTEAITLKPESPLSGATDVPLTPVFHWTAIGNADYYELVVARDASFTLPVVSRTGNTSLPENAWLCNSSLETGTTYYWKIRACTANSFSAWSGTGIFTTVGTPGIDSSDTGQTAAELGNETISQTSEPVAFTVTTTVPVQIVPTIIMTSVPVESGLQTWTLPLFGGILGVLALIVLVVLLILIIILKTRLH